MPAPEGSSGRKIYTWRTMTAEQCAQVILRAAFRRQREVVMQPGTLGIWLKLIVPGLLDRLTVELFFRPAVRRTLQDR